MSKPSNSCDRQFRDALGQFATGVTVITTLAADGSKVGLTASSFNSASLNPPLVLWSLSKKAGSLPAFETSDRFNVHVLAHDQVQLSNRFASRVEDRFAQVEYEPGLDGIPLLSGCAAYFQCRKTYEYEGGDHIIFVGEVLDYSKLEREPLVFHSGNYALTKPHGAKPKYQLGFLVYLLGRCFEQAHIPFLEQVDALGMDINEARVLGFLSGVESVALETLKTIDQIPVEAVPGVIEHMLQSGLLLSEQGQEGTLVRLSDKGKEKVSPLLAAGQAIEERVLDGLNLEERALFKSLLAKIAVKTQPDLPLPVPRD